MDKKNKLIYFITTNSHKFNEIYNLFRSENLDYKLKQLDVDVAEIQANTLKEVALFKLNNIKSEIKGSFFVEDAGFFVDTPLNGFPGVYSSYVMKTIGNKGILRLIDDFEKTEAHFTSVIALFYKPFNKIQLFEGISRGKVSKKIKGSAGFGFDPIFLPNDIPHKTFAELTTEEKNNISHRGKAWKKLIQFLREVSSQKNPA